MRPCNCCCCLIYSYCSPAPLLRPQSRPQQQRRGVKYQGADRTQKKKKKERERETGRAVLNAKEWHREQVLYIPEQINAPSHGQYIYIYIYSTWCSYNIAKRASDIFYFICWQPGLADWLVDHWLFYIIIIILPKDIISNMEEEPDWEEVMYEAARIYKMEASKCKEGRKHYALHVPVNITARCPAPWLPRHPALAHVPHHQIMYLLPST